MDISQILSMAERVKAAIPENLNEANTKTSLIFPFLQAMGYDVFDHNEVAQEYTAEWGTKKGEKVDIAILREGLPSILIECKPMGDPLDTGKCSQLFRYFSTQPARIGILTNGQRYLFLATSKNKMSWTENRSWKLTCSILTNGFCQNCKNSQKKLGTWMRRYPLQKLLNIPELSNYLLLKT